jgi:uncharacterized protein YpmS
MIMKKFKVIFFIILGLCIILILYVIKQEESNNSEPTKSESSRVDIDSSDSSDFIKISSDERRSIYVSKSEIYRNLPRYRKGGKRRKQTST